MKKILILIPIILFLCSGCYDYIEINDIAIVSGISIEYGNNEYQVGFEILNTKNKEDSKESQKAYFVKGTGTNISEAFSSASLEIAKAPYLAHLKTIIISEEIAKNHIKDIIDFIMRDNNTRNIFYLVIAKNATPYEILSNINTNNQVASKAIADLIENTNYVHNISSNLTFENFLISLLDPYHDTYLASITIENNVTKLGPIGIFNNYQFKDYLTEEEASIFNLLNNSSEEMHLKLSCPDDSSNEIILSTVNKSKTKIEVEEKEAKISPKVEMLIIENHCKMDFKNEDTYKKIEENAQNSLKEKIENLIYTTIKNDSDILKINKMYYQKNKKNLDFKTIKYNIEPKVTINRNGQIFEVNE